MQREKGRSENCRAKSVPHSNFKLVTGKVTKRSTKQGQREGAGEDGEDFFRFPKAKELYKRNLESHCPFPPQKSKPWQGPKMSSRLGDTALVERYWVLQGTTEKPPKDSPHLLV